MKTLLHLTFSLLIPLFFSTAAVWGQSSADTPTVTLVAPNGTNVVTTPTQEAPAPLSAPEKTVGTLDPADLMEFTDQPDSVKHLILNGLALTQQNLKYQYGSDDPKNGGMDCSGTVSYLLRQQGYQDVPRDASDLYKWAWQEGNFRAVVSNKNDTFELKHLHPGDLLFWTGTYKIDRDPPVTHVMIYLGTNRQTGHRVMLGASEGRQFDGKSRYGVSVFDFILNTRSSDTTTSSRFIGYSPVPHLRNETVTNPQPPSTTNTTSNP